MNIQTSSVALLIVVIGVSCVPGLPTHATATATATVTMMSTPTVTLTLSTPLPFPMATFWVTSKITATPLDVNLDTNDKIINVIKDLHLGICPSFNLARETPSPSDVPALHPLEFIEVDVFPDSTLYYVEEIADNLDGSLQAVIACQPEKCQDQVYLKDNRTQKAYQIKWDPLPWRPIQWLVWLNKDSLMFAQSSNPHYGTFVVIDIAKKGYQYYGMATDQYDCSGRTPTP